MFHHYGQDQRIKWYHLPTYEVVCASFAVQGDVYALPGKPYKLPATSYATIGDYTAQVIGAWILAHPESARAAQAKQLGRAARHIRHMQPRAAVKQLPRGVRAFKPDDQNEAQAEELGRLLPWNDQDSTPGHFWRGPGGSYAWQISNTYFGGLAVDLGWKRAGRIRAAVGGPVDRGRASVGAKPQVARYTPRSFEQSYDPSAAVRLNKYQTRHPDALTVYFGDLPNQPPRASLIPTRAALAWI